VKQRPDGLILLTPLAGLIMVVAAFAHIGRYRRFVSHLVMLGFLTGIGVDIILSQVPDMGVKAVRSIGLTNAINALAEPSDRVGRARRRPRGSGPTGPARAHAARALQLLS
jgi:SulP family sulfate permease